MSEGSFGMRDFNLKEQLKRLMPKDSLERTHAAADMISTSTPMVVREHTFAEKKQE